MAQVTTSYATPTNLCWAWDTDSTSHSISPIGQRKYKTGGIYKVTLLDTNARPCEICVSWVSSYETYQVQYRSRKRYSPAHAQAVYGTTSEQWTDWSEWDGASITGTETISPATEFSSDRFAMNDTTPFATAYDFATYDAIEWQVRVRVYNQPTAECSEWLTETLHIAFQPTVNGYAEWYSADTIKVTYETNWSRGGTIEIRGSQYWQNGRGWENYTPQIFRSQTATNTSGATITCLIKQSDIAYLEKTSKQLFADWWYFRPALNKCQEITVSNGKTGLTLTPHPNSSAVTAPVITLDEDTVSIQDVSYTSLFAYVEWVDDEGRTYAEELTIALSNGVWSGLLLSPPYDTELYIRAVAVGKDTTTWAQSCEEFTILSNGRLSWTTDDGDGVKVRLFDNKPTISLSEELEGETSKPAGRNRPLARYGTGGTRTISCTAAIMRGDMNSINAKHNQSGHQAILNALRKKEDMWFRAPNSGRYRVRVKSFSLTQNNHYEILSVDMEEVE